MAKETEPTKTKPTAGKDKKDSKADAAKATKPAAPVARQGDRYVSAIAAKRQPKSKDFRGVVRLVGKDIDGHLYLIEALRRVKGIGHSLTSALQKAIQKTLSIPSTALVGDLTEEQLTKVEELMKNPAAHGVPKFLLNRQKDYDSGVDKHLVGTDLVFQTKQDIEREKESRSWIGWRHSLGQKVRGQHTRTTGRTGMTVGVVRKALAKAGGPTAEGAKEEKK